MKLSDYTTAELKAELFRREMRNRLINRTAHHRDFYALANRSAQYGSGRQRAYRQFGTCKQMNRYAPSNCRRAA